MRRWCSALLGVAQPFSSSTTRIMGEPADASWASIVFGPFFLPRALYHAVSQSRRHVRNASSGNRLHRDRRVLPVSARRSGHAEPALRASEDKLKGFAVFGNSSVAGVVNKHTLPRWHRLVMWCPRVPARHRRARRWFRQHEGCGERAPAIQEAQHRFSPAPPDRKAARLNGVHVKRNTTVRPGDGDVVLHQQGNTSPSFGRGFTNDLGGISPIEIINASSACSSGVPPSGSTVAARR